MANLYWSPKTSTAPNIVGNWTTNADGSAGDPSNIPWMYTDSLYLAHNLVPCSMPGAWNQAAKTFTPTTSRTWTTNALQNAIVTVNGVEYTVASNSATVATMTATGSVGNGTYNLQILSIRYSAQGNGDDVLSGVTGVCSIPYMSAYSQTIYGGIFTVSTLLAPSGGGAEFYGGVFNVTTFTCNGVHLHGGIYNCTTLNATTNVFIYGGVFNVTNFVNNSYSYVDDIMGGFFNVTTWTQTTGPVQGGIFNVGTWNYTAGPILGGNWWLSGRMKINGTTYTSYGTAKPASCAAMWDFHTDNCQLTADKILTGSSVTELGTLVEGTAYPTTFGPVGVTSTSVGPWPIGTDHIGPYHVT